jgi:D-alanyl-D-alanine dipeptidase
MIVNVGANVRVIPLISVALKGNLTMIRLKISLVIIITILLSGFHILSYANDIEQSFIKAGLIDIHSIDSSIKVDLVNSDPDKNYFRENFYQGLSRAYMHEKVARRLSKAQGYLKSVHPGYSLLIMDAARPRSVSRLMYEKMKGIKFEKYVANPQKGSMHNYGVAVDVTIVDAKGKGIDMGFTPFYKNDLQIYLGYARLKAFGLSKMQKENRGLLKLVMTKAGFIPLSYEWWHFDGIPKDKTRKKYNIIK